MKTENVDVNQDVDYNGGDLKFNIKREKFVNNEDENYNEVELPMHTVLYESNTENEEAIGIVDSNEDNLDFKINAYDVELNTKTGKKEDPEEINHNEYDLDFMYVTNFVKRNPNHSAEIKQESDQKYNIDTEYLEVCRGCKKSFIKILSHLSDWKNGRSWKSGSGRNCQEAYTSQELKYKREQANKEKKKRSSKKYSMSEKGKERLKRAKEKYSRSQKGKNCKKRWKDKICQQENNSQNFQELKNKWEETNKDRKKLSSKKYFMSEKGKERLKCAKEKYRRSQKGKERLKCAKEKYRMSQKEKERLECAKEKYGKSDTMKTEEQVTKGYKTDIKRDFEEHIYKGYKYIIRRETEGYEENAIKDSESYAKSNTEEIEEKDTNNSRFSTQAADSDSHSDIEVKIGGSIDKSDQEEKIYKGFKYIIRRETEETKEPVLKGHSSVAKRGHKETKENITYSFRPSTQTADIYSDTELMIEASIDRDTADIASDTELMIEGSFDRDYSCKVTNCQADFWFKSELEKHMQSFHKPKFISI